MYLLSSATLDCLGDSDTSHLMDLYNSRSEWTELCCSWNYPPEDAAGAYLPLSADCPLQPWGWAASRAELGEGPIAQPAWAAGTVGFIYIVGWGLGKKQTGQNPPLWDPGSLCCCAFFHPSSICCCDLLRCHALIICLGQFNCQVSGEWGCLTLDLLAIGSLQAIIGGREWGGKKGKSCISYD